MAMAEAGGPTQLLEMCGQRLSRFLQDAEHKRLAWLREVEEQGMRLLDGNFGAEPELMPKTPSQRRRPKKRRSSCLKDENKEPNRRRLSRRRSGVMPVSSKLSSQKCPSKDQPRSLSCPGEEVSVPEPAVGSQASVETHPLEPTGKWPAEAPMAKKDCGDSPQSPDGRDAACRAAKGQQLPEGDVTTEPHGVSSIPAVPGGQADGEEAPKRGASTSTPKAARNGDPAMLQGDLSPQGLKIVLFQDSDNKTTKAKSKTRRCSGRQSSVGGPSKSHRTSLVQKYSLAGKRESMIRRSISRAISKKAASRESSSASSRVSCQSSLEVFVEEDGTSSVRPSLELNPLSEKTAEDIPDSSKSAQVSRPPAQHLSPPEQQAGKDGGSCVNPTSEAQNKNQEQPRCAESQQNPSRIWTRTYKQAMGTIWNGQQQGGQTLSPLDDKHKSSANQAPASSSPASRVVRPLKNFLQAVQRNQLLTSPGPTGRGGIIKNFIKHNTPTRPNLKGDFVEKERQRLESLRKKQEAEEQRRKKVEEEKRRRQAEMKQKREERLRKALQARERVEQMEEEKKKRMEQKILQNDDKVRLSQGREEKGAEERSRRKLLRKPGEADTWKQKAPRAEEDEFEQQGPLQKRREDEMKEKGNKVLELRNLVEQQQVEQAKERDHKLRGKEKAPKPELESAVFAEENIKEAENTKEVPGQEKRAKPPEPIAVAAAHPWLKVAKEDDGLQKPQQQLREEKKNKQPEALSGASGTWLSKTVKKPISTPCLVPPKGTKESRSPTVNENNYGMDLNSDDSTDDENDPRKPVPAWADGSQLNQAVVYQYYHPLNVDQIFGLIPSPKLEDIFGKTKPRYFKRTSSAVWHSPPGTKSTCGPSCNFKN
ncbi:PREDICTED: inner centromere protein-like [Calidris pugnax]|uniref:inner centromere protein-like n=1 Tax=Calidris pugnax TaxID=198806 RepID=UPI00071C8B44|nr:PREDICTED: inner centromere protein-like [Calidris pugnax]